MNSDIKFFNIKSQDIKRFILEPDLLYSVLYTRSIYTRNRIYQCPIHKKYLHQEPDLLVFYTQEVFTPGTGFTSVLYTRIIYTRNRIYQSPIYKKYLHKEPDLLVFYTQEVFTPGTGFTSVLYTRSIYTRNRIYQSPIHKKYFHKEQGTSNPLFTEKVVDI